jgi:hypothetical protein
VPPGTPIQSGPDGNSYAAPPSPDNGGTGNVAKVQIAPSGQGGFQVVVFLKDGRPPVPIPVPSFEALIQILTKAFGPSAGAGAPPQGPPPPPPDSAGGPPAGAPPPGGGPPPDEEEQ